MSWRDVLYLLPLILVGLSATIMLFTSPQYAAYTQQQPENITYSYTVDLEVHYYPEYNVTCFSARQLKLTNRVGGMSCIKGDLT